MYFPDYDYAACVLKKMLNKCRKGIIILDINDVSNKLPLQCLLRGKRSEEEYNKIFSATKYLYYSRQWFQDFFESRDLSFNICDQFLEFPFSRFRFNVYASPEKIISSSKMTKNKKIFSIDYSDY